MSLVRTGAVELGPLGIRVNAIAPGVVWTPRVSGYLGEEGAVPVPAAKNFEGFQKIASFPPFFEVVG